jgi:hypothetical protein
MELEDSLEHQPNQGAPCHLDSPTKHEGSISQSMTKNHVLNA